MEQLRNEMLEDIKREEQLTEQDVMSEMENLDLNSLFTFGINFDMLKLVINNLIKSNYRVNYKIAELKLDKIKSEQRSDQLELAILDMQIANEQSYKAKSLLQEKKSKLQSKDYKKDIDMILKEKEYYSNALHNQNRNESYKLDKIINNISKFNLGVGSSKSNDEIMKKMEEYNTKLTEENKSNKEDIENFKNQINLDISAKVDELATKLDEAKSLMISNDKEFILMKKTIQNSEEKIENKLNKEFPEYIDNLLSNKISELDTRIAHIGQETEKNLKKVGDNLRDNLNNLQKNFEEKSNDTENKILKMRATENNLSEKIKYITNEQFKEYVPLKTHKQLQTQLEEKMLSYKNQQMAELEVLNNNFSALKNQINEFMADKTDHNNLNLLGKKFEAAQNILYRAQILMDDYEKEKKRYQNLDPKKVVTTDSYEEFKSNINKTINNFHKEFQEMKTEILDKNSKFLGSQASLKDLKNLEDDLLLKMDELYTSVNDKFAEKNLIIRNNKILELKMKHIVENYKKNDKSDTWLLSKIPIGHLCASCESYLGDIKDTANTKYVPWNKYPTKDSADKLYRVGAGYSRMLQMISPDNKNKVKNSSNSNVFEGLSPIGIGKKQEMFEDTNESIRNKNMNNSALNANSIPDINNKGQSLENQLNLGKYKLPNLLRVKHLKKNSTFSNFYSENLDEQNKSSKLINNNTGLNFSYLGVNNKGRDLNKVKNEDSEKDEIIHSPNTAERKIVREEEKKGPKILKVIKKK
jgi:hypothetical protein